jgi:hypothetical protein
MGGRFNLYWVNADSTTTLLAENGQHVPRVSFYGDYAYTVWQTAADRHLLIIDMRDAHHVSTSINPTLEIAPPYGKIQDQIGDVSIVVLGSTDHLRATFLAINHSTGQTVQLLNQQAQIKWIARADQPNKFHVGWLTTDGRQMLTVFSVDGTPQATFNVPGSLQSGLIKISPDGSRAIEFDGLSGDHYLSFSDGSFKELLPVPATLTWMPDSKHIVGANAILGNSASEAYLLDADGALLASYPLPYPASLAPTPLVKCP